MKYILRIIGLPFFAVLLSFSALVLYLRWMYNYCRYGSETIVYTKERNPLTIQDSLNDLIEKRENVEKS